MAAEFCLTIFKTIRGFGGAAISATQDLSDFFGLEDGKYGRAIINNSKTKILLNLEPDEAKYVRDVLRLTPTEVRAVTRFERLEPDPGRTCNTLAYTYYGQVEYYDILTNEAAPDFTILLLKDSYSAPIGTFMSLLARHVLCVDLRRDVQSLDWWLDTYHPDAVVMAYSLQMLRDDEYEFG